MKKYVKKQKVMKKYVKKQKREVAKVRVEPKSNVY